MKRLAAPRGAPELITAARVAEKAVDTWAYKNDIKLGLIRFGKPVGNGCIASFNGRLCDELPKGEIFFDFATRRGSSIAGALTTTIITPLSVQARPQRGPVFYI
jgi:transposase InsO family protein